MRIAILGWVFGICWLQTQAQLPSLTWLGGFFASALLIGLCAIWLQVRSIKWLPDALRFGAGAVLGFAWAALFAQHYLARELPREIEGEDVTVIGTIASLPDVFHGGVRFQFAVEQVVSPSIMLQQLPPKLALGWYDGFRAADQHAVGDVQPGERWQLTVRLQRPHGNANPYGFDYEIWLLEQNLRATGYVRPDDQAALKNSRLNNFVFNFNNLVEHCRARLRARILSALPNAPYAGVIVALVVGDQRAVAQSDWQIFNRTGIGHLISISGLHITLIAGLFAALAMTLWRHSFFTQAELPLLIPAQKIAALAGAFAALIYVLLAGFGVPAQRTLYMLSVIAAALWFDRLTSVSHVLCLALALVLLLDPWAVAQPGFWLSFGAVAIILYATNGRRQAAEQAKLLQADAASSTTQFDPNIQPAPRWRSALAEATHVQFAVTLGLIPLTMLLFGQISLVSPLANAIAIPLVSFLVTPLALIGSVLPAPLAGWTLGSAHFLTASLAQVLAWFSALPAAVWNAPIPEPWMFGLALAGSVWLLTPLHWWLRIPSLLLMLPALFNQPDAPPAGQLRVTAFDVGQGMALLVETAQHRLLYDTGPAYAPESDGGNRVILPYLKARGITKLDGIMISHNDADHSGGALSIFKDIKTAWTSSSLAFDSPIVQAAPNHRRCNAGQSWNWDGVQFDVLHPVPVSYDSDKWKPNARSCTLKITRGQQSILLAGDIEAIQESELVTRLGKQLHADVLLAPHHGSGTSSTLEFLQMVNPQIAIFQVGYRNRYRHPKAEVWERYAGLGIQRLRTDEAGAVTLRFGNRIEAEEYRAVHARYWYQH